MGRGSCSLVNLGGRKRNDAARFETLAILARCANSTNFNNRIILSKERSEAGKPAENRSRSYQADSCMPSCRVGNRCEFDNRQQRGVRC
jgi:hypothetical protein